MFVDEIWLEVAGGRGGSGAVSFRREKYVPRGGPDGGDGGDGGSVYLQADPGKHSFLDLHYRRRQRAGNGGNGAGGRRNGRRGTDLIIPVPLGTIAEDGRGFLGELTLPGQRLLVAAGGGGRTGNNAVCYCVAPGAAAGGKGTAGRRRRIYLELKLMAQGLVGFPNAGKSTLLSRILQPVHVWRLTPLPPLRPTWAWLTPGGKLCGSRFARPDRGAHQGAGLGHRFLRHVERNLVLLLSSISPPDAVPEPQPPTASSCGVETLQRKPRRISPRGGRKQARSDRGGGKPGEAARRGGRARRGPAGSARHFRGHRRRRAPLVRQLAVMVAAAARSLPEPGADAPAALRAAAGAPCVYLVKAEDAYIVSGRGSKGGRPTDFENEESLRRFQLYCRRSDLDDFCGKRRCRRGYNPNRQKNSIMSAMRRWEKSHDQEEGRITPRLD